MAKTWQGRFKKQIDPEADKFNASVSFDKRLFKHDVAAGIAHAGALSRAGIITAAEGKKITSGLKKLLAMESRIDFSKYEDVHSAVEMELTALIGDAGKKLHTGRSRNDLVATDTRLYVMEDSALIEKELKLLLKALLKLAKKNTRNFIKGYTHMQQAQYVSAAHWAMAYFEMFKRDLALLSTFRDRVSVMPLGSGAIAGSNFAIDRAYTAKALGFKAACANSMDGVSDRDFAADFCYFSALSSVHLSRMAEEIIIYATTEFNLIDIDDSFATGSSLMPQKKNPDIAELLRGKSAGFMGNLLSVLAMMKGLPLTYNKDMQEDKETLFRSLDGIKSCLHIAARLIDNIAFKKDNNENTFMYSVDVADYLVEKGVPFRDAHEITGKLVGYCVENGKQFTQLSKAELASISPKLDAGMIASLNPEKSANMKKTAGSPSVKSVEKQIADAERFIK
ncbi:MAG TPA: argininosuccinate lyase [Candidatus Goldiibacteriota bacterium]|nr:argininosuccinate lyase [Candidatus Goldiibacteriota bacterium]HPN64491.1 argininosuccinate lyase [Candidatus Goldiibacteriota bacterium]HRQ44132.1 argininosuccinate lyase [Candidatus Goldiibacteriota bacterium]